MLKDLFKPGRKYDEYVNSKGEPKIHCISCGRRPKIRETSFGYICGDEERFKECNPENNDNYWVMSYELWTPRVDYSVLKEGFIDKEEFNV